MICMTCIRPVGDTGQRPSTLVGRLAVALGRAWRAYWSRRAGRAVVLLLREVDKPTLREIGFNAAEIACLLEHERLLERGADRRRCR